MEINRNNFEHYYRLYLDGSLDPVVTGELMLFFSENPELEASLDSGPSVLTNGIYFSKKDRLRKSHADMPEINEYNFDEFCVARLENLLSQDDNKRLDEYLRSNPGKAKDAALIAQLTLGADISLLYKHKSSLKKTLLPGRRKLFIPVIAIAASVVFFIVLFVSAPEKAVITPDLVQTSDTPGFIEAEPAPAPDKAEALPEKAVKSDISDSDTPVLTGEGSKAETITAEYVPAEYFPAPIEPVNISRLFTVENPNVLITDLQNDHISDITDGNVENERQGILTYIRDFDLWETTELAVKGFNILTESNLSVARTPQDDGKTRISLDSDGKTIISARVKGYRL